MLPIAAATITWGDTFNSALGSCKNGASYVKEWGSYLIGKAGELVITICEFARPFFQAAMNFVLENSEAFAYGALTLGILGLAYVVYARCIRADPAETPAGGTGSPVTATGTPAPTNP